MGLDPHKLLNMHEHKLDGLDMFKSPWWLWWFWILCNGCDCSRISMMIEISSMVWTTTNIKSSKKLQVSHHIFTTLKETCVVATHEWIRVDALASKSFFEIHFYAYEGLGSNVSSLNFKTHEVGFTKEFPTPCNKSKPYMWNQRSRIITQIEVVERESNARYKVGICGFMSSPTFPQNQGLELRIWFLSLLKGQIPMRRDLLHMDI